MSAWHAIRRNSETSRTASTKQAAREFGQDLPKNLRAIQDRLRKGYRFAPAYGATPAKGGGKPGKRPIVVAPLSDRIVQRAILDVLQDAVELSSIQRILATPTSVGGIRGRGVDNAIAMFDDRQKAGDRFVAGSDISGFFTKIPRNRVVDVLRNDTDDHAFVDLFDKALTVELANESALSSDDRKLFPTGTDGVAQGCPLSALAGNILLEDFDRAMNAPSRGITCIRYIDDFILIGRNRENVTKALASAKLMLSAMGMDIYDPVANPTKAFIGKIGEPHVFLGYQIVPGLYPPAPSARDKLINQIETLLNSGKKSIRKAARGSPLNANERCYAQTLVAIDHTVRGWRGSFRSSICVSTFEKLDREIERRLTDFDAFFRSHTKSTSPGKRRRALGINLLG